ncbi:uncharacterized protein LOC106884213 [Octopus bimaculoides]|uniref:Uncharacterized protein n=1 Tax=Octopus bimaculoides TaxID=37653 RepID=A0A0L8I497_OCTBM|nr:uncharacterized protein LOC106884213 [Octopus bimaculoides]|eukprot:XP_014790948.1 PREDICTED: uncharacterized protein LOC106884213 [Octopus bimaculoides]
MEGFQKFSVFLLFMIMSTFTRVFCKSCTNAIGSLASVMPKQTDQFYFQMEMTDVKAKSSMQLLEYYDGKTNQGLMDLQGADRTIVYYNLATHKTRTVLPNKGKCSVSNISESIYNAIPRLNSRSISGVAALFFKSSDLDEQCLGITQIRGIWCYHWKLTMKDDSVSFEMDWYFSAPMWSTATQENSVPVRYMVKGSTKGNQEDFQSYYDFFQFRKNLDGLGQIFETTPGIACYEKTQTKKMPKIPDVFSAYLEYYDEEMGTLISLKENFDRNFRLSMITYANPVTKSEDNQANIVINDFNEDVAYNINSEKGDCRLTEVSKDLADKKKSRQLTMVNSKQFFGLRNGNFTYQGVRKVRDIDCDVWVGKVSDEHLKDYVTEIYFSTINELDNGIKTRGQLVGFSAFMSDENKWQAESFLDMFGFSEEEPSFENYDVSSCFKKQMMPVTLWIEDQYKLIINLNTAQFKLRLSTALISIMKISPLRIQKLQLLDAENGYIIQFSVTEQVNFNGGKRKRTSLIDALKLLSTTLEKKELKVKLGSQYESQLTTIPIQGYLNITITKPLSYGQGSMAALGTCMTSLGFLMVLLVVKLTNRG